MAFASVASRRLTVTNCPGQSFWPTLANVAFNSIVPVAALTALSRNDSSPFSRLPRVVRRRRGHLERPAARDVLLHVRERRLGDREPHVHGLDLVDDDERLVVVGLHDVPGVHEHAAHPPRDRRRRSCSRRDRAPRSGPRPHPPSAWPGRPTPRPASGRPAPASRSPCPRAPRSACRSCSAFVARARSRSRFARAWSSAAS